MKAAVSLEKRLARSTRRRSLLAVLLLPAALSWWTQAADASQSEQFSGMYSPTTQTQYDGVAVYGSTNSNGFTSLTLAVFSSVTVNTTANLGPVTVLVPDNATNLRVGVFSLYGGPTSKTVSLTLGTTYAASIDSGTGTAFSSDFVVPSGTTTVAADESTIAGYIFDVASNDSNASASATSLESFFNANSTDFPLVNTANNTASGTIVTFSNAAAGGSASLSLGVVPEPSTYALLGAGAVALGLAGHRRRAA